MGSSAVDAIGELDELGRDEAEAILSLAREIPLEHLTPQRSEALSGRDGPIVICVVRNEIERLSAFLTHYRRGDVAFFAFVDNGSQDGTLPALARQDDVDLFVAPEQFGVRRKQAWITQLIERYGRERWYILVDADEHLVFDGYGESSFPAVAACFEARGRRRVRARLIDMYADAPVLAGLRPPELALGDMFPFFDADGYREWDNHQIPSCVGGPRARLFQRLGLALRPQLTKFPLFRPGAEDVPASPHYIWPFAGNFDPGVHLALLHYKFDQNPLARCRDAVQRDVYWQESAEYRAYVRAFETDPLLTFYNEHSRRYRRPHDLIDCGLLDPLPLADNAARTMAAAADVAYAAQLDRHGMAA